MTPLERYEENLKAIGEARLNSHMSGERDIAWTLRKIKDTYRDFGANDCMHAFVRWTLSKWTCGMNLPQDLTKFLQDKAHYQRTGDALKDWDLAQEEVVKEVGLYLLF